jgi:hypothetical protein
MSANLGFDCWVGRLVGVQARIVGTEGLILLISPQHPLKDKSLLEQMLIKLYISNRLEKPLIYQLFSGDPQQLYHARGSH